MHEMAFATVPAEPAQDAAPVAAQAATGAPVWVWPLLMALIALGVSRMRDREMPVWRLLLLPAILSSVSVLGIIARDLSGGELSASLAGAVAGLLAGGW